ncbi:acyltransferase family protein [Saccharibacillus sacchari]|uniref:acyltransferase family protein n=1 Tax=Saccharibacillus sacchari TaxID=456493 RepID=UPI000A058EA9|nr:acyltransferase family protein [Saccharibacillus sacchari]
MQNTSGKTIDAKNRATLYSPNIHGPGKAGKLKAEDGRRHMNGLDGLRAVAVLAVIAYHLDLGFLPGGLFGVGLFFVLSGYLITDILLSQWHSTGSINLADFYIRRARRLLPGMFAVMAAIMIWLFFADPGRLSELRGDLGAGALYISNWWYIFHHVSYFESFGPPSPFGHFWSLAVEEQFYVVWPLLLLLLVPLMQKKGPLLVFIIGLALLSAEMMALFYNPDLDPSRVYYGTDTRAFALLAGAALAVVWPSQKLSSAISLGARIAMELTGAAALAFLIYVMLTGSEYDPALYTGGMALQALAAALLIAALAHPTSVLARMFGIAPLRWIGRHSYGLYLWHYPVIVLTTPSVDTGGVDFLRVALQLLAVFVLAAVSLKVIEDPIRRHGFRAFASGLWKRGRRRPGRIVLSRTFTLMSAALIVLALVRMTHAPEPEIAAVAADSAPQEQAAAPSKETVKTAEQGNKQALPSRLGSSVNSTPPAPQKTNHSAPAASAPSKETQGEQPTANADKVAYTVIGDSVILDAKPYLEESIAKVHVDGKVGRQMWEAPDLLSQLESRQKLGGRVVIELGTNGSFNSKKLNEVLDSLQGKEQVYLVTVRVPRSWERTVNRSLTEACERYDNVSLIDWYSASAGHNDYFSEDGVHLTPAGADAFAGLVKQAVEKKAAIRS